jgi:hypothetical protein
MWIVSHVHLPPYSFLLIEQFCRNNNKLLHTFCFINLITYLKEIFFYYKILLFQMARYC